MHVSAGILSAHNAAIENNQYLYVCAETSTRNSTSYTQQLHKFTRIKTFGVAICSLRDDVIRYVCLLCCTL